VYCDPKSRITIFSATSMIFKSVKLAQYLGYGKLDLY